MNKNTYKILIVDDIAKNIQILGNILSRENYEIAYAQYGEQALSILENQQIDLILLDIMMPGMNGFEVCRKLQEQPHTAEIPVIFLTAKADMESIVKGFECGGRDYITKPFNSMELLARVKTHLQVNHQKKQLQDLNDHLEEKVAERTKQLQEANKKLELLDKAKSDFLSIISHELRTPLNGIIGLTNLLDQTNLDNEQAEYIEFMKDSANRLRNFAEISLLITSLSIEEYRPEMMPVAIDNIIEAVIYELNDSEESLPEIKINIPDDTGLVLAETDLTKTSLKLILQNAFRYGGREQPVEVSVSKDNQFLYIDIEDNGPGFSEEAMEHLFELFSTTDIMHSEGKGLSLAAVKLIMDIQEGNISIENKPGNRGAKVRLTFKRSA